VNFHVFSVSGDFFWKDGEYFAKKVSGFTIPTFCNFRYNLVDSVPYRLWQFLGRFISDERYRYHEGYLTGCDKGLSLQFEMQSSHTGSRESLFFIKDVGLEAVNFRGPYLEILRSEGRDNFRFWFWQFLVNLNKCAKFI
jgi:hypothetical protein